MKNGTESAAAGAQYARSQASRDPSLIPPAASFLAADRGSVPKSLLETSVRDYGTGLVGKDCYISPEWHRREVERLWGRVWQLACLEQDIPNVGDHLEYVIATESILVVRESASSVRAFFNACRHRGSRLKVGCGNSKEIRCGFHAWAWNLDGTLKDIPCRWDFPSVRDEEFGLKSCKVALWNGFVFVNLDPNAESFESFLGKDLMRHFAEWPSLATRWKAVHVAKEIHCNWKLAIEAFVEAYHAFTIHPQWTNYAGDLNSQYDAYGKHARAFVPLGVPSPHRRTPITEQEIVNSMITTEFADAWGKSDGEPLPIPAVPEGGTARATLSDFRKKILTERTGMDFSRASDTQMLDLIEYWVFPNTCIWVGEGGPLVYRARPNGNNPESCIWETMILLPVGEGRERPPAVPTNFIPAHKTYAECAPEVGTSAKVFEQDSNNLAKMQLGLHSQGFPGPMFGKYMEMNIRQFHQNLERLMSDDQAGGR